MKFAIVGRANKGKSSIVATLVENDRIMISPTPGTTQKSQEFTLKVGDRELFSLVDTPGFEEAPAALEWLKSQPVSAHQRKQRIQDFYETFNGTGRFAFECELLRPIIEGAAFLYVVDASLPYRSNFEAEFEILQWTGQPSVALLNQTGDGRFAADWQSALDQYFKKTLHFNAHTARFEERMRLLDELRFISGDARPIIDEAKVMLENQQQSRLRAVSFILAELITEALLYCSTHPIPEVGLRQKDKDAYLGAFLNHIRDLEKKSRNAMAETFEFNRLESEESDLKGKLNSDDLFSAETWSLLGLSRAELIATGTAAGALAGGVLDAMVGGASFLIGTGLGAALGSLSTGYLAFANPEFAGIKLSRKKLTIGPIKDPNFPWILLDRGLIFMLSILHRTHAQQSRLLIEEKHSGPSAALSKSLKTSLTFLLQKMRLFGPSEKWRSQLAESVNKALQESALRA